MEKPNLIREKTYSFALEIIKLYKKLIDQNEYILSKQLKIKNLTFKIKSYIIVWYPDHKPNNFSGLEQPPPHRRQPIILSHIQLGQSSVGIVQLRATVF